MFIIVLLVVLSFGLGAIFGAPFVPTHRKSINQALDMMALEPGQRLLDLGAGSGTMLVAAARRGLNVTGIEINPILWFIANIRLWPYRRQARVILGNYWLQKWPVCDGIYVFLIGHYMDRFERRLRFQTSNVVIVSNIFELPNHQPTSYDNGLFRYDFRPE